MRDVALAWVERVRAVPAVVVDVGLAFLVLVVTLLPEVARGGEEAGWGWVVALALMTSVPLVWRQRAPLVVTVVAGVGTTVQGFLGVLPHLPYGQLVATYSFAALCSPVSRLLAGGGTVLGTVVAVLVPAPHEVVALLYNGMPFVAAYALGSGARTRRERMVLLAERGQRERAAAVAAERARIAGDMHDVLAHSVGLIVVQAEGGAAIVGVDQARAVGAFDAIAETGREALVQVRQALGVLREGSGDRAPLAGVEQIPRLVEATRRTGLEVSYGETGTPTRLRRDVSVAAYRVVQEALTNAVKHADARRVEVALDWADGKLEVLVRDDGRGIPTGSASGVRWSGGQGLVGMEARVSSCGGDLRAGADPDGGGFRVRATLPTGATR